MGHVPQMVGAPNRDGLGEINDFYHYLAVSPKQIKTVQDMDISYHEMPVQNRMWSVEWCLFK